tara:strand:- start:87 stop:629 length:543 start_codon:yes stop_codon:yes gene_type:complete
MFVEQDNHKKYRFNFYYYFVIFSILLILVLIDYYQWFNLPSQLDGISDIVYEERGELIGICCFLYIGLSIGISWARGWPNSPDVQLKNQSKKAIGQVKQKFFVDYSEFWKTTFLIVAGVSIYLFMIGYFGDFWIFTDFEKYSVYTCFMWLVIFIPIADSNTPKWVVNLGEWLDELAEEEE